MGDKAKELEAAGIAVFGEYGMTLDRPNNPARARKVILGYLGNEYIHVISGANSLKFTAAPLKGLVDLKTMKLELMEEYSDKKTQKYTVDEMIQHCKKLHP